MSFLKTSVDVSTVAAFPARNAPTLEIPFEPDSILLTNESADASILVSFSEGVAEDIVLRPAGSPLSAQEIRGRYRKLWFKRGGTSADPITCIVEASNA